MDVWQVIRCYIEALDFHTLSAIGVDKVLISLD